MAKFILFICRLVPYRKVEFVGLGRELEAHKLQEIVDLRLKLLKGFSPYLNYTEQEKERDLNSYHIIGRIRGELYGVIRLTPYPFELIDVIPKTIDIKEFKEYVELNRLVTKRSDPILNKLLSIAACCYAKAKLKRAGALAIAYHKLAASFQIMGMQKYSESFVIPERDFKTYQIIYMNFNDFWGSVLAFLSIYEQLKAHNCIVKKTLNDMIGEKHKHTLQQ